MFGSHFGSLRCLRPWPAHISVSDRLWRGSVKTGPTQTLTPGTVHIVAVVVAVAVTVVNEAVAVAAAAAAAAVMVAGVAGVVVAILDSCPVYQENVTTNPVQAKVKPPGV